MNKRYRLGQFTTECFINAWTALWVARHQIDNFLKAVADDTPLALS